MVIILIGNKSLATWLSFSSATTGQQQKIYLSLECRRMYVDNKHTMSATSEAPRAFFLNHGKGYEDQLTSPQVEIGLINLHVVFGFDHVYHNRYDRKIHVWQYPRFSILNKVSTHRLSLQNYIAISIILYVEKRQDR